MVVGFMVMNPMVESIEITLNKQKHLDILHLVMFPIDSLPRILSQTFHQCVIPFSSVGTVGIFR